VIVELGQRLGKVSLGDLIRDLRRSSFCRSLALELFNCDFWRQDAMTVVRVGPEKRHAVVRQSLKGDWTKWWRPVCLVPPPF
jgi:hypothetical protein